MKKSLFVSIIITFLLILPLTVVNSAEIEISQDKLKQGEFIYLTINDMKMDKLKIIFNDKQIPFFKDDAGQAHAFIAISYWLPPGNYPLNIHRGEKKIFSKNIQVVKGAFPESNIKIKKEKEKLIRPSGNSKLQQKKEEDRRQIRKAYSQTNPDKLWESQFAWPVEGEISTDFGATRYVNGKLSNRHSGIDIAAPVGTPVKAINNGIIRLAEELVVTGNTIIIDHGWGLFSSYSHLNSLKVSPGERVEKGDIIGTIGSTGFSTGPHLHWVVKINGTYVNPKELYSFPQKDQ